MPRTILKFYSYNESITVLSASFSAMVIICYDAFMIEERIRSYFEGKKITVMGLGLLGRGLGDAAFLAECGAKLIVTDLKSEEELHTSVDALKVYPNIIFHLGGHNLSDFEGCDLILQAAGIPPDSQHIAHAQKNGIEVVMSASLFAKLSRIPIIGITGTRGKSTVTHMIHHVLLQTTEGAPVLLGGNVRGVSNLQLLRDIHEDSVAVMELDSWQLQGFGYSLMSPHIAVFTNFMEDHLNYYKGDMDAYFKDKANIFRYQDEGGVFVTTSDVFERAKDFMMKHGEEIHQEVRLVDTSILPDDCLLSQPGEHNRLNAALATEALRATGLTDEEIFVGLATFPGVPGRLEYLGEKDGIKIYNDNNATTPQATIEGIKAVSQGKNVILILGGSYKEVDPSPLIPVIEKNCKEVVLIPGTGTNRIIEILGGTIPDNWNSCVGIDDAIGVALSKAEAGDVILFSPAFASFGMFKNEYERNDAFCSIINRILNEIESV